jgi:hypothetical protein
MWIKLVCKNGDQELPILENDLWAILLQSIAFNMRGFEIRIDPSEYKDLKLYAEGKEIPQPEYMKEAI